ncbi:MAG: hypothetical protein U1F33_01975 [Alphaproteobacteria bacterium]
MSGDARTPRYRWPAPYRAMWVCIALAAFACTAEQKGDVDHPVVASGPVALGPPVHAPAPPPRIEVFYGEGSCAPVFPNGQRGTCINGQPCNGFGFKTASGALECACFETKGGCPAEQRCSTLRRACVGPSDLDRKSPAPAP